MTKRAFWYTSIKNLKVAEIKNYMKKFLMISAFVLVLPMATFAEEGLNEAYDPTATTTKAYEASQGGGLAPCQIEKTCPNYGDTEWENGHRPGKTVQLEREAAERAAAPQSVDELRLKLLNLLTELLAKLQILLSLTR